MHTNATVLTCKKFIQHVYFKYILEKSPTSNKLCVCVFYVTYQEDLRQIRVAARPLVGRPRNRGLFPGLGRDLRFFQNLRTSSGHYQASSSYEY